jgi:phosphoribosylformylglycinamidine synthase
VAEAWRNLTAVGATPLAVTDCLNYGNPEKPEIMWQIVAGIDGLGEACRALDFPIVSGNCSLYNETQGEGILPTPTIGGVGLMKDVHRMATIAFKREGDAIVLIGETKGHLGQTVYLREVEGKEEGAAPPVDLAAEKKNGEFVRGLIESGRVDTVHDVSDGGLLVALAEMALAGNLGAALAPGTIPFLFGEDQARYVLAAPDGERLISEAKRAGIAATLLGTIGGDRIAVEGAGEIAIDRLRKDHEGWLPAYMTGEN